MSWQDSLGSLGSALGGSSWNSLPSSSTTYTQKLKSYGYDYGSHNATWSTLASGRLAPPVGAPKPDPALAPANNPPAKFDAAYPTSYAQAQQPPQPPHDTTGDIFGSIGAAAGSTFGNMNLANAVPWLMERTGVLAQMAAQSGIPVVSEGGKLASVGTDFFIDGVTKASDMIAPWLNAFPDYVRDGQLHDRTKIYQALINGDKIDWGANGGGLLGTGLFASPIGNPIETAGELMRFSPFGGGAGEFAQRMAGKLPIAEDSRLTGSVSAQANALNEYRDVLLNSIDPEQRMNAQQALELLREAIDIPQSVKVSMEMDPTANDEGIQKMIESAPEGKAWSYRAGPEGVALNMATPLLFYVAEARLAGGAGKAVSAFGSELGAGAQFGSAAHLGSLGVQGLGKTVTIAAGLQKWALRAGAGTTILTTTADAVARTLGQQAAVDWFDRVNRTTLMSDNPNVQLVTSFSVNPLAGTGKAAKGILRLAHGAGDLAVGAVVGKRLLKAYNSNTLLVGMVRRMYSLDTDAAAQAFIDDPAHFENRGQAFDHVLQASLEDHLATLRPEERAHIAAMPALERTTYVAKTYIRQALDLMEHAPDLVAKRWQLRSAEYHQYAQGFDPEVAAINQADYRTAATRTLGMRTDLDAVVGYREALPPQAQSIARGTLDRISDLDGTIAVKGLDGVNGLIKDFPVLRKYWQGKIGAEARVPRATVERMIEEASADYARLAQENPIRARTGRDPVLRPSSPSKTRDIADAVRTNIATVDAIYGADHANASAVDLVRKFLEDKGITTGTLTPEEVMVAGDTELARRITPWQETGQRVQTAEKRLAEYRSTAATLRREGKHGRAKLVDAEAAKMAQIIGDAGDPLRPFADTVETSLFSPDVRARAARKVDARVRLGTIDGIRTQLHEADLGLESLDSVVVAADGKLAWAPDVAAAPPTALADAFIRFKTSGPYNTIRKTVGHYNAKHTEEIFTRKAQDVIDVMEQGTPGQQWQAIADSPGFVAWLRKEGDLALNRYMGEEASLTGHQAADLVESLDLARGRTSQPLAAIAERMGLPAEQALQKLSEYQRAYRDALDGRTEASLRTSRDRIKVSDDAITQAEADRAVRETVFDPEYEAWGLPERTAAIAEITANPTDHAMWTTLRSLMEGDDAIANGIEAVAARAGVSVDDVLADSSHAAAVRAELVPQGFTPPVGRLVGEATPLDTAILHGDDLSVSGLARKFEAQPPVKVARSAAATLSKRLPKLRKSYQYAKDLNELGVDGSIAPDAAILADPRNSLGLDVISVLNYGVMGTRPQTLDGLIAILRTIENRHATAAGVGTQMQAEAQRVAKLLLDKAKGSARKQIVYEGGEAGTIGPGIQADHMKLAEGITRLLTYDDANPLATLQYGLKKRPKGAVVLEWSAVPGLAEELMSKAYVPHEQRLWTAQARQLYNMTFGPKSNASVRAATKLRFVELAAAKGVDAKFASDAYDTWQRLSQTSRTAHTTKNAAGRIAMTFGDNPLYADVWNIPNARMNLEIHGSTESGGVVKVQGLIGEMSGRRNATALDAATAEAYRHVDFADLFRTAGSFTKRQMLKGGTLGEHIAQMYGMAAHNSAVTTHYFTFRFGLDLRFHAQNFFEAQILGLGMAGFRKREVAFGEFGMDEAYLQHLSSNENAVANTGMPLSRGRHQAAYNVFLKLHGDPLRKASKGLATEDPALMSKALEQVRSEPVTADMIAGIKANPDDFIKELDAWHAKMLKNVDAAGDGEVIDQAIAEAMKDSPELSEVLTRLGDVNKQTWGDIRETIYGNPNRSQAERLLNSYWLYWPLSYQIKSTKWFAKVLFDSAGGMKTNAGGAWLFDQMATTHQQQLQTNPKYQQWFEKHRSLVFMAQMLFPVSFDKVGVSLNPVLRDLFFGASKEVMGVGPIYSWGLAQEAAKELYADLQPTFGDAFDGFYAMTGQQPTAAQKADNAAQKAKP